MGQKIKVTESLDIDVEKEAWCCNRCGAALVSAKENYKKGCLVAERDPLEVHRPIADEKPNFAPDPEWCRIIEFYCPQCGVLFEVEYLPPGHPITHDIDIDLEDLKTSIKREE